MNVSNGHADLASIYNPVTLHAAKSPLRFAACFECWGVLRDVHKIQAAERVIKGSFMSESLHLVARSF
ncbi:MAG TPA: hypothetical protein PLG48_03300 [Candidatus Avimonas sp.]|nr:hypothetical protein [Candidatus Avimonas sp.]